MLSSRIFPGAYMIWFLTLIATNFCVCVFGKNITQARTCYWTFFLSRRQSQEVYRMPRYVKAAPEWQIWERLRYSDGKGVRGFKQMRIDNFLYVFVRQWQMQHSLQGFPCLEPEHCNQLPPRIITLISCHSIYHCRHHNSYHFSNVYNVQCTGLNALMHYFTESLRQLWSRQYNYSPFSRWRNWHF